MSPTLRDLKTLAKPKGIIVSNDAEAGCYRAEAPAGRCFRGEYHEMVEWYTERETMGEARADLARRLQEREADHIPCPIAECDWCSAEALSSR